jgi:hypothetical protein
LHTHSSRLLANVFSVRAGLLGIFLCTLVLATTGCAGGGAPPPMDQLHIETVAGWYQSYRSKNAKPPPNEEAFIKFIEAEQKARGQTVDIQKLFTSPRDGQKYVINYKPNSTNMDRNVVVYESQGAGGTKWLAFENKWSEEVDDAKLQEYLARK